MITATAKPLTEPQQRMLVAVRNAGPTGRVYNGRARRTIEALVAAGHVTADFDLVPAAIGAWYWRITVVAV